MQNRSMKERYEEALDQLEKLDSALQDLADAVHNADDLDDLEDVEPVDMAAEIQATRKVVKSAKHFGEQAIKLVKEKSLKLIDDLEQRIDNGFDAYDAFDHQTYSWLDENLTNLRHQAQWGITGGSK